MEVYARVRKMKKKIKFERLLSLSVEAVLVLMLGANATGSRIRNIVTALEVKHQVI